MTFLMDDLDTFWDILWLLLKRFCPWNLLLIGNTDFVWMSWTAELSIKFYLCSLIKKVFYTDKYLLPAFKRKQGLCLQLYDLILSCLKFLKLFRSTLSYWKSENLPYYIHFYCIWWHKHISCIDNLLSFYYVTKYRTTVIRTTSYY